MEKRISINSVKAIWTKPLYRFLISFLLLFLLLYYFNIFYIGITAPGGFYSLFLDLHLNYIRGLRLLLLHTSADIIRFGWGYDLYTTTIRLHVDGHGGVVLVYSCLGYGIMSVFAAFVLAWPGKSWPNKMIFLLTGLMIIQALNICRIVALSLLGRRFPGYQKIDHHDLFNIIVYLVLLTITYIWTKEKRKKKELECRNNKPDLQNDVSSE